MRNFSIVIGASIIIALLAAKFVPTILGSLLVVVAGVALVNYLVYNKE